MSEDNQQLAARPPGELRALAPAKLPILVEFQSDAVEIEERAPPRIARVTLYCLLALMTAAAVWASVSSVDSIVTGQGKLTTTSPNLVVQPLETSVVRKIHVKVGDVVKQGQVLATLDPTFSQADVDQLRARFSALDAASKRLQGELDGADYAVADPSNPDEALQEKLFR